MSPTEIKAEVRDGLGKEKSKKMRGSGKIPAVLYGHGKENHNLLINARDFGYLESHGSTSGVLTLKLEGSKKPISAIIKEIQKNPVNDLFIHIDFLEIDMNETVTTTVPVSLIGVAPGVKMGGVLQHGLWELNVRALPGDIPSGIEVDITCLKVGDSIKVADLIPPKGVEILNPEEDPVVLIMTPAKEEEVAAPEEQVEPKLVGKKDEEA